MSVKHFLSTYSHDNCSLYPLYQGNLNPLRTPRVLQVLPHCSKCSPTDELAIMKPDIVFFGESLPDEFHHQMDEDKQECDLLIVIGSSLKVRPVALIPRGSWLFFSVLVCVGE